MKHNAVIFLIFSMMIIPAAFLSYFAIRGIDQQEADLRKDFENTLLLELTQTNTQITYLLDEMKETLHESLPDRIYTDTKQKFQTWKNEQKLIGMPYLLSKDHTISYPDLTDPGYSKEFADAANLFYWRYLNFFSNSEMVPIYRNIAVAYEEEILKDRDAAYEPEVRAAKAASETAVPQSGSMADVAAVSADDELFAGAAESAAAPEAESDWENERPSPSLQKRSEAKPSSSLSRSKAAVSLFETNEALQEQVYQQAEKEGQVPLTRNVTPQLSGEEQGKPDAGPSVRSVYIESTRNFEELIKDRDYGLIPRIFDSAFILLYWEKQGEIISGCELDMDAVRDILVSSIDAPANGVRYINILDNGGRPLIPFASFDENNWRRPLVAKEINELLPYWETAILLADPEAFEQRIQSSRLYMFLLILLLSAAILTGMTAVYRFSASQLKAVQQKAGFVTRVSHELKTPLTSIRMYSEMLAEDRQKDESKRKKYLSYIASESLRLSRLISNVLDYAKLEKGTKQLHPKTVDMVAFVNEYVECVRDEYSAKGFLLNAETGDTPLYARIDNEAFTQVFVNLLNNAEKYSVDEKRILIRVSGGKRRVYVSVVDSGTGIPPRFRKKVFKDFYRIDNRLTSEAKGTGLGLAIVKRIIKAHGGGLSVTAKDTTDYTKGSVFTISLPEETARKTAKRKEP